MSTTITEPKYLDDDERNIIEDLNTAIDKGDFKISSPEEKQSKRDFWIQAVKNTEKRKAITLRLQNRDISRLKAIARRKGLPYQTFIASSLHQLANGDLIERS